MTLKMHQALGISCPFDCLQESHEIFQDLHHHRWMHHHASGCATCMWSKNLRRLNRHRWFLTNNHVHYLLLEKPTHFGACHMVRATCRLSQESGIQSVLPHYEITKFARTATDPLRRVSQDRHRFIFDTKATVKLISTSLRLFLLTQHRLLVIIFISNR